MLKSEFGKLFAVITSAYGKEINPNQAEVYYEIFKSYEYDSLKSVIEQVIRTNHYFPTVSDILEIMYPTDTGRAWQKVISVAQNGCKTWTLLTDSEIVTISEIGGMAQIQDSNDESLRYIFNKFEKVYPIIVKRRVNLETDNIRLKTLGIHPETMNYIKNTEEGRKLLGE